MFLEFENLHNMRLDAILISFTFLSLSLSLSLSFSLSSPQNEHVEYRWRNARTPLYHTFMCAYCVV
jgi:flagellar assembly factor FliW